MIMYPLDVVIENGITDIMIVSDGQYTDKFKEILCDCPCRLTYGVQSEPGGIAQALGLTEGFANGEHIAVILGDNIYEHIPDLSGFQYGARIYLKEVPDARRFGVATLHNNFVEKIVEKPEQPETNLAVTGLYLYDSCVYDIIKQLKPSSRNELEITDVNNEYIAQGLLEARCVEGWWTDAGTFESLHRASDLVREKRVRANTPESPLE